jgi:hypothetical protein
MNFLKNLLFSDEIYSNQDITIERETIMQELLQKQLIEIGPFERIHPKISLKEFQSNIFMIWGNRLTMIIPNWKEYENYILIDSKFEFKFVALR